MGTPKFEDTPQRRYDDRVRPKVVEAIRNLTKHDGHDPNCEVCGYRVWWEDGKSYCQEGCPVRPLRMFL